MEIQSLEIRLKICTSANMISRTCKLATNTYADTYSTSDILIITLYVFANRLKNYNPNLC